MTALLEPPTTAPVLIPQYTASGYNAWLFYEVMHQIMLDPTSWNQDSWAESTECGTTRCVAGWAAHLSGYEFQWFNVGFQSMPIRIAESTTEGWPISTVAFQVLGLEERQADRLFGSGTAETDDLWDVVEEVTGNEISYLGYREWLTSR